MKKNRIYLLFVKQGVLFLGLFVFFLNVHVGYAMKKYLFVSLGSAFNRYCEYDNTLCADLKKDGKVDVLSIDNAKLALVQSYHEGLVEDINFHNKGQEKFDAERYVSDRISLIRVKNIASAELIQLYADSLDKYECIYILDGIDMGENIGRLIKDDLYLSNSNIKKIKFAQYVSPAYTSSESGDVNTLQKAIDFRNNFFNSKGVIEIQEIVKNIAADIAPNNESKQKIMYEMLLTKQTYYADPDKKENSLLTRRSLFYNNCLKKGVKESSINTLIKFMTEVGYEHPYIGIKQAFEEK